MPPKYLAIIITLSYEPTTEEKLKERVPILQKAVGTFWPFKEYQITTNRSSPAILAGTSSIDLIWCSTMFEELATQTANLLVARLTAPSVQPKAFAVSLNIEDRSHNQG